MTTNPDAILEVAFEHASTHGVGLRIVHAHIESEYLLDPQPTEATWLHDVVAPWALKYPEVPTSVAIVDDSPSHAILDESRRAQLIVVGTHGHGTVSAAFIGSTSRAVLHHAAIPTIVVPATAPAHREDPER